MRTYQWQRSRKSDRHSSPDTFLRPALSAQCVYYYLTIHTQAGSVGLLKGKQTNKKIGKSLEATRRSGQPTFDISNRTSTREAEAEAVWGRACGDLYAWFLIITCITVVQCEYLSMEYGRGAVDAVCGGWLDGAKQWALQEHDPGESW